MTGEPRFFRLYLGRNAAHLEDCLEKGYIGVDFDFDLDLTGEFPDDWRPFNKKWRPWLMERHPELSGVAAGLACGMTWSLSGYMRIGDLVLCPDGLGSYRIARIAGSYRYNPDSPLPHQRPVEWLQFTIQRSSLSEQMWRTMRVPGTLVDLKDYQSELQLLMSGEYSRPRISVDDSEVQDAMSFAFESHLEDFIIENWASTEFGRDYDIYTENGFKGTQIPVTGGRLDILAVSKDQTELLVIELKRGRASDSVVGQMLRYLALVEEELAGSGQSVRGVIIALEDDLNIRYALKASKAAIKFMRYEVRFNLIG